MSTPSASIFCRSFFPKRGRITEVLQAVDQWCAQKNLDEDLRRRLKLVLDEILANLVQHAHFSEENDASILMLTRTEEGITLCVEDPGDPFDPRRLEKPDTDLPLNERPIGGLGLLLVEKMADEFDYYYDERNVLTVQLRYRDTLPDGTAANG